MLSLQRWTPGNGLNATNFFLFKNFSLGRLLHFNSKSSLLILASFSHAIGYTFLQRYSLLGCSSTRLNITHLLLLISHLPPTDTCSIYSIKPMLTEMDSITINSPMISSSTTHHLVWSNPSDPSHHHIKIPCRCVTITQLSPRTWNSWPGPLATVGHINYRMNIDKIKP